MNETLSGKYYILFEGDKIVSIEGVDGVYLLGIVTKCKGGKLPQHFGEFKKVKCLVEITPLEGKPT
jgi:hypothetical protein